MTLAQAYACSDQKDPVAPELPQIDTLLSVERVKSLPLAQQNGWMAYLSLSAQQHALDVQRVRDEVQHAGLTAWWPAPAGADFRLTSEMTGAWFATTNARQLANIIVSFQTASGGWSKAVAYARSREPGQSYSSEPTWSWIATFDNGATTEQLRFLGAIAQAQSDSTYKAVFARGFEYIIRAQFPNGCWPQTFPLEGGYHDAATYNDHVTARILQLLGEVAAAQYPFVAQPDRLRAHDAIGRAIGCIIASQMIVSGKRTVWGQQHDPLTLAPVKGRSYEPAALCSLESASLVDALLGVSAPSSAVVLAIETSVAWLREHAIYGYIYDPRGVLVAAPGAGPLWARFYQIGTNRPIFSDRDGIIRYDLREVGDERRSGYAWYVTAPTTTIARYDLWKKTHNLTAH